jgi:ribonuclease HII
MMQLHSQHPQYKWQDNKGYGTAAHLAAIKQFGITEHHRKTFAGCK